MASRATKDGVHTTTALQLHGTPQPQFKRFLKCAELQHKGTLTVLEQPNTLTGHSHGCLILAIMNGDDMAVTIPWRRPWHPLPGVAF
jgi:hypothetical protein